MKYVKITALLLSLCLLCLHTLPIYAKSGGAELSISAGSACLIEAESGKVLYERRSKKRMPMASTTKIMTAIVALESGLPLDTVVKVSAEAVGTEGSSMYLREGEQMSLETLLYGLLLSSANDAAVAIAMAICGSTELFVENMNKKAEELGLSDTHFENPNGLHADSHYTTAEDLAHLMAYCMRNSTFAEISGCRRKTVPRYDNGARVLINHNKLLSTCEGVIAGKTGYTRASGRCLVTCAERNGLRLIAVTLNDPDDWRDHASLYSFGYSSYKRVALAPSSLSVPVISGKKSEITCSCEGYSFFTHSGAKTEVTIKMPRFLFAPIKAGDTVGHAVYTCDGRVVASIPITACENAELTTRMPAILEWLINLFKDIRWKK